MKKELNTNNNKKLIIAISTLFCTIILSVGATTAFFSQSQSETMGNIVSVNEVTLKYTDNKVYMKDNLIPTVEQDVPKFAMKNSFNDAKYTDDDICKFTDEYNACSLYEFTIENTIDAAQSLVVSMSPTLNQYNNLYFILYKSKANELNEESKVIKYNRKIEQETINFNGLNLVLKGNTSETYTIVFYIKNLDYAQDDLGKRFAASISVNSITTGYNISTEVGEGCYESVKLDDGTYKLTRFNGINHETGDIVEGCEVTKDDNNFYSITVPSTYGGNTISTLGNTLFFSGDVATSQYNKFQYIKEVKINEGITTIEDGFDYNGYFIGIFASIGYDFFNKKPIIEEGIKYNLPNSLKYIGSYAFNNSYIKEMILPNNIEYIGDYAFLRNPLQKIYLSNKLTYIGDAAFAECELTSIIIPKSVKTIMNEAFIYNDMLEKVTFETDNEYKSSLESIGTGAFAHCNLNYQDRNDPLIIPSSILNIKEYAFYYKMDVHNPNLKYIQYLGDNQDIINNTNGWYDSNKVLELITKKTQ